MTQYPIAVGGIDPCFSDARTYCDFSMPGAHSYGCTMPSGHGGPHIAHNESTGEVLEIEPEPIPEEYQVDEGL